MVVRLLTLLLLVAAARADDWLVVVGRKKGPPLRIRPGKTVDPTDDPVRPGARLSPDGKRWLYAEWRDKNRDLYACDLDGKNEVRLTTNPGMDADGSWAPDGKRILFHSQRAGKWQVCLRDADGKVSVLTSDERGAWVPRLAPDGKRVAFLSLLPHQGKGWKADLVVLDLATKKRTRLVGDCWMAEYAWSPDGTRIAIGDLQWFKLVDVEKAAVEWTIVLKKKDRRFHAHAARNILWRPDGRQIAMGIHCWASRAATYRTDPSGSRVPVKPPARLGDHEIFFLSLDKSMRGVKLPEAAVPLPVRWVSAR